jgi:SAM-dependent methyltransferase
VIVDGSVDSTRGVAEHWYTDDQFNRQLGSPAQTAVIHRRWKAFASALRMFLSGTEAGHSVRMLDAGCGDGINLVGLRRILFGLRRPFDLFAIDMSALRVERARAADRANGRVVCGSVTALPFESATFDVVLCNHVIEHVSHPEAVAAEIARVLRPGGLCIVGVPNEGSVLARVRNHILQRSILSTTDHVNFFTGRSLSRLLQNAGLTVEGIRTEGFFVPHLRLFSLMMASAPGRALLDASGRILPSQAADLIAFATRKT